LSGKTVVGIDVSEVGVDVWDQAIEEFENGRGKEIKKEIDRVYGETLIKVKAA